MAADTSLAVIVACRIVLRCRGAKWWCRNASASSGRGASNTMVRDNSTWRIETSHQ